MITKDEKLETLLSEFDYAGISVLHATKEGVDYFINLGKRDLENNLNIDNETIFRIASISKVIVALSVMTLVEKGILDIYEDVSKYLGFQLRNPLYPDDIITLEQIMTQTSSITDGFDDPNFGYDAVNGPHMDVSLKDLLTNPNYKYYTSKTFLNARPKEEWRYSNFGCGILACIIEKVTGKYFTDYVKEVLLNLLKTDSGFRIEQIIKQDKVASLYEYDNKKFILQRDVKQFLNIMFPKYELGNNFRGPAGGLFISVMDLSKIMLMMMNKGTYEGVKVLNKETIEEMEKVHWSGWSYDPEYRKKGLQLCLLDRFSKDTLKGHFGYAYGLRSFMLYNNNHGYIFMCNGGNYELGDDHMIKIQSKILTYLVNKFEG